MVTRRDESSEQGLAQAEQAGRVEAEAVDLHHLLEESLSREQHWMDRALGVERSAEEAAYTQEQRSLWATIRLEDEIERLRTEAADLPARALAAEQAAAELESKLRREAEQTRSAEQTAAAASLAATELEAKLRRETERTRSAEQTAAAASLTATEPESRLRRETERCRTVEQTVATASSAAREVESKLRREAERARLAEDSIRRLTAESIAKSQDLETAQAELTAAESALAEARRDLERYAAFHRSLEKSSGWRIIQAVRRLLGAKW